MPRVIKKEDCEIIEVENHIRDKIVIRGTGGIDMEAINRAEAALGELSSNFDDWLKDEVEKLVEARDDVHESGLEGVAFDELYRIAHDIKGQGETLGYPLATLITASLCKLLATPEDKTIIPVALIDNHVDAVRRVMRDKIKNPDHESGRAVAEKLLDVVFEFTDRIEAQQQTDEPDMVVQPAEA